MTLPGKLSRRGPRNIVSVEVMILETLTNWRPSYGEELIRELAHRTGGLIRPSIGAVYVAMKRLEQEKLIAFDHVGPSVESIGGRPANYFYVTLNGEDRARQHRLLIRDIFREMP